MDIMSMFKLIQVCEKCVDEGYKIIDFWQNENGNGIYISIYKDEDRKQFEFHV